MFFYIPIWTFTAVLTGLKITLSANLLVILYSILLVSLPTTEFVTALAAGAITTSFTPAKVTYFNISLAYVFVITFPEAFSLNFGTTPSNNNLCTLAILTLFLSHVPHFQRLALLSWPYFQ